MSRRVLWLSLVLLAGCGGHGGAAHSSSAPAPELVPFDAAQPEALAAGPATPAPACRASQLRPSGALQFVPAVPSGGTGGVILRNTGPRPCRLDGRPGVRFIGGTAPPPQRQRPLAAEPLAFPRVAPPVSALIALAPGKGAVLSIAGDNCAPRPSPAVRPLPPPKPARVTLPRHGGSLDLDYSAVAPCEHAGRP